LYVLRIFPQVSQTYVKYEIEALRDDYDIHVITQTESRWPYGKFVDYETIREPDKILAAANAFKPHVLHSHWLHQAPLVAGLAQQTNTPFTLRAHSFDILLDKTDEVITENGIQRSPLVSRAVNAMNSNLCAGVLTFPFTMEILLKAGVRPVKLFECFPVVNYDLFHDESPNGQAVMNVGACTPKKNMDDFLKLAELVPQRSFHLYPIGYESERIAELNKTQGNPITIEPIIEPEQMPAAYKKCQWLVYTADFEINQVGWPIAVAEAMASGVGVCVPRIRDDMQEYVGDAGILYDNIEELPAIISKPVPEEMRQAGFKQAQKSDINRHKILLSRAWDRAYRFRMNFGIPD